MDTSTYLLGTASLVAAVVSIPRSPARRPAIGMCIVLAVLATSFWAHSELSHSSNANAALAPGASPSDAPSTEPVSPDSPPPDTADSPQASDSPTSSDATDSTGATDSTDATDSSDSSSPTFESAPPSPTKITLGQLCDSPNAQVYICGESYGGTMQVGQTLFSYAGENNGFASAQPPDWGQILQFPATTCTSLTITFATGSSDATANIEVVQSSTAPVTASAAAGTIGTLHAKLDGGPFKLQANSTTGAQVFANGYAICDTASGES